MEVDCRRCVWFVPLEKMSRELRKRALQWCAVYRPRASVKGWCRARNEPVTYYIGTCTRFKSIDESLLRWLK